MTTCVSGPGLNPRSRARGVLVRGTARTIRTLPCRPGPVPIATTAATRHLSRHSRSRCLLSRHAHRRVTTPRLHSTFKLTPGDAATCSCMATDISRVYRDLTHTVFLPTHGRSLSRASYIHTTLLTPTGALTRGVSFAHRASHIHGGTNPRCLAHAWGFAHTCRFPRARGFFRLRCPFHTRRAGKHARRHIRNHTTRTRGLTRNYTRGLSRGALTHGDSSVLEGSGTHGVALTLAVPRTQRLSPVICVRRSTHFATLVNTHRDTTHTGTTLSTTHTPGHSH